MPNRILRDWTDSTAVDLLSCQAEIFFTRLIMKSDDYGRFFSDERLLKANLFPLRINQIRDTDLQRWIAECMKAGLVRIYEVDKKSYIEIVNFGQRLRQAKKRFPDPEKKMPASGQQVAGESPPEVEEEREHELEREGEENAPPPIPYSEKIENPLEDRFELYTEWTDLILEERDQFFPQLLEKEKIEFSKPAIKDHLDFIARYNWKFDSQQKFRRSVIKHIKEFIEKQKRNSGGGSKFQQAPTDTVYKSITVGEVANAAAINPDITAEKNRRAREQNLAAIEADVVAYSDNENCIVKIAALKFEILWEEKIHRISKEEFDKFFDEAKGERIRLLNLKYDNAASFILTHYRDGKIPETEIGILKTIAKELAYRNYLKKRVNENVIV